MAEIAVGGRGIVLGYMNKTSVGRQKLMAMGLLKGTEFEIFRVAPMGDPLEIKVRGYNLSLRKEEAEMLLVREV